VLPTNKFRSGNIAVGVGVKFPTGNPGYKDTFPNSAGNLNQPRYVDQSVQPGDGGYGLLLDVQAFKRIPHAQLFGAVSYLANPRDFNDTTSGSINRSTSLTPTFPADGTGYNSVPDQFLIRLGGAVPFGKTGFVGSLSWRAEGLPRYDLIGESHGFRRPGIELFIEPGFTYAKGKNVYSFQTPVGYYRNRYPNPNTGSAGDATFPNYIFLASYGYRFGGKSAASDAAID